MWRGVRGEMCVCGEEVYVYRRYSYGVERVVCVCILLGPSDASMFRIQEGKGVHVFGYMCV